MDEQAVRGESRETGREAEESKEAHLVGPSHDRERPETGREPSIENILVLLESVLPSVGDLVGSSGSLLESTSDDPRVVTRSLET